MVRRIHIKNEKGYLLISTLFVLLLSSFMVENIIRISRNHIIQLNQLSQSYEEKAVLNLAEKNLMDTLIKEEVTISHTSLSSSLGKVEVKKRADNFYELLLINRNGENKKRWVKIPEPKDENKGKNLK